MKNMVLSKAYFPFYFTLFGPLNVVEYTFMRDETNQMTLEIIVLVVLCEYAIDHYLKYHICTFYVSRNGVHAKASQ